MTLSENPTMWWAWSWNINQSPITLRHYYSSFKSLSGVLASTFGGLPLFSKFLPGNAYSFPPVGDVEPAARLGLVILAFGMTFGVYFWGENLYRRTGRVIANCVRRKLAVSIFLFCPLRRFCTASGYSNP